MKTFSLLILFSFLFSMTCTAQKRSSKKSTSEKSAFEGKWQEYGRKKGKKERKAKSIQINDSMQLEFMPDSTVRIWFKKGRYYNGRYFVDRKGLHASQDFLFEDYEVSQDELTLQQGLTWHYFKKVKHLEQGAIKKVVPVLERGPIDLSASNLTAKWSSYKKEDKAFSTKKFYMRKLVVLEQKEDGSFAVEITEANMSTALIKKGSMTVDKERLVLNLDKDETMEFSILKLDKQEMILSREGAILYFMNFDR